MSKMQQPKSGDRLAVAQQVYQKFLDEFEVFGSDVAIQLSYLLGAIAAGSRVDYFSNDPLGDAHYHRLLSLFPDRNAAVWRYVNWHVSAYVDNPIESLDHAALVVIVTAMWKCMYIRRDAVIDRNKKVDSDEMVEQVAELFELFKLAPGSPDDFHGTPVFDALPGSGD